MKNQVSEKKPDLKGFSLLLLDDYPLPPGIFEDTLRFFGVRVAHAAGTEEAVHVLAREHIHVIVASLRLVDERCIEMIREHKARYPDTLFYLLTEQDYDRVETSLESVNQVVDDYLQKPLDALRFARMIETALGRPRSGSTSLSVVEPLVATVKPYFLFRSSAMRGALASLPGIAASGQTVLISGETGTGKELVARSIHVLSPRSAGPFIPINCGAIPESLIEGELFGHEKGAFTGAHRTRKGKFETAHNGTLFLDEIGDMPLTLQVRLLRVLEEKKVYRVGGESPIPVNVRVIAATRIDLAKAVSDGLFREDLYYRLNVLRIHLPPLRERIEDIPLLAVHFLDRVFAEMGRIPPYPMLSSETIYLLERYPWRGNVRELRNVMTRVATLLPPGAKQVFPQQVLPSLEEMKPLSPALPPPEGSFITIPLGTSLDKVEERLISETLKQTNGNRSRAAKLLGISLRTLRRKLNRKK
ncbi:MAG: sigma-54-dependent Fis family transcriptional regulator [Nitrospirales bacterium]|nr:sigma-54-dependent Fis family transcriptional regulator [Nitrospirales bacterium]